MFTTLRNCFALPVKCYNICRRNSGKGIDMADTEQTGATLRVIFFTLAARAIAKGKSKKGLAWLTLTARPDDYLQGLFEDICSAEYEERLTGAPAIVEKNAQTIRNMLDEPEFELTAAELDALKSVAARDVVAVFGTSQVYPPFDLHGVSFFIEE